MNPSFFLISWLDRSFYTNQAPFNDFFVCHLLCHVIQAKRGLLSALCSSFPFFVFFPFFQQRIVPIPPTANSCVGSHLIPSPHHPSFSLFLASPLSYIVPVWWGVVLRRDTGQVLFVTVMNTTPLCPRNFC